MAEISTKMPYNGNLPTLPDDIIVYNILTRAGAKTVGKFRCASKEWRSHLSTRAFVKLHHTSMEEHKSAGIIIGVYPSPTCFCIMNFDWEKNVVVSKFSTLPDGIEETSLCGSFNGLVLVAHYGVLWENCGMNLFNPVTRETHSVPCYPGAFKYSLGYVGDSDDYRIVALSKVSNSRALNISVYSLMERGWRFVGKAPFEYFMYEEVCMLNGSLHYVAGKKYGGPFQLVAFSLEREMFREVAYPKVLEPYMRYSWGSIPHLTVIRGCLAFVIFSCPQRNAYELWIMREYNVQDSWEKYRIPTENCSMYNYIGVLQDEFLVFKRSDDALVVVSMENWIPTIVNNYDGGTRISRFQGRSAFRESLFSQ